MFNFIKDLFRRKNYLGLEPLPYDARDFDLGILGWGDYKPKNTKKVIPTLSVKKQKYNTCGWTGTAAQKEVDEKVILSMRSLVAIAKREKSLTGDGFSNLRSNELMLQKFGVAEESIAPSLENSEISWNEYSNPQILTLEITNNAELHKSGTFWQIWRKDHIFKAIDEDRTVGVGLQWFNAYNMQGGFQSPWILPWKTGSYVGGHKVFVKGYDLDYQGKQVFHLQNSFGIEYGLNGDFFIETDKLMEDIKTFGAFINLDVEKDLAQFLQKADGAIVKDEGNVDPQKRKDIYYILNGEKHLVPDEATLMSYSFDETRIIYDADGFLKDIPRAEDLVFWQGKNVVIIKQMLQAKQNLKPLFKKYFEELLT